MRYSTPQIHLSCPPVPSDDIDLIAALSLWKTMEVGAREDRREMIAEAYCMHIDHLFTRYSGKYRGGESWDNPRKHRLGTSIKITKGGKK